LNLICLGYPVLLHPGIYFFPPESDQASNLVMGYLLDLGVECLGLDAEVAGKFKDSKKVIRGDHPSFSV
jgi:hypothetical protein